MHSIINLNVWNSTSRLILVETVEKIGVSIPNVLLDAKRLRKQIRMPHDRWVIRVLVICVSPERIIFDRVRHRRDRPIMSESGLCPIGDKCQLMQQRISLYALQESQSSDHYAVIDDYRVTIDVAQASVHFYRGKQEWGRLAGTVSVEKWTGDWLIRSIGRFLRIDYQLNSNKALASIQRNGYLAVRTVHAIGNVKLYERLLAGSFWDYAISFRNEAAFGSSVSKIVAELRTRLNRRDSPELATISLRVGPGSRFDQQQLLDFCQTNQLTPGGAYTQQELRQLTLRQRKINCEQFQDQLRYFNIRINCR